MARKEGKNTNTNTESNVVIIPLNSTTAVTISTAVSKRGHFHVNNDNDINSYWIRYYPALRDNIKQGYFVSGKTGIKNWHTMDKDEKYLGEISAIAVSDSPDCYLTEY